MPVHVVKTKAGTYEVRDKDGKVHGKHGTNKAKANRQVAAINRSAKTGSS